MHIWNISSVHFLLHNLDMKYEYFNNNPAGRRVGDCAVRAVSKALNIDWEKAYVMLAVNGFIMADIMNANNVIASVLRQNGFYRKSIDNTCPDCFSVKDFCKENPKGTFVLGTGAHVVTAIDGNYYDVWDSGDEIITYVWYLPH
jgi:hypothetical protein